MHYSHAQSDDGKSPCCSKPEINCILVLLSITLTKALTHHLLVLATQYDYSCQQSYALGLIGVLASPQRYDLQQSQNASHLKELSEKTEKKEKDNGRDEV